MQRSVYRPLMLAWAVTLTAVTTACGGPATVSPLPVRTAAPAVESPATESPATESPASESPAPSAPSSAAPVPSRSAAARPSACHGTERVELDLATEELALVPSMCFRAGGVLRLKDIGPGLVKAEPAALVAQSYEAGIVDVRFVRQGTVAVRIPQNGKVYTITVVIS